jgi:hypothetical protein
MCRLPRCVSALIRCARETETHADMCYSRLPLCSGFCRYQLQEASIDSPWMAHDVWLSTMDVRDEGRETLEMGQSKDQAKMKLWYGAESRFRSLVQADSMHGNARCYTAWRFHSLLGCRPISSSHSRDSSDGRRTGPPAERTGIWREPEDHVTLPEV